MPEPAYCTPSAKTLEPLAERKAPGSNFFQYSQVIVTSCFLKGIRNGRPGCHDRVVTGDFIPPVASSLSGSRWQPIGEKYYQAWKNEAKRVAHAEELLQQAAATLPQMRATQDQAGRYLVQARRQLEPHRYQIALLGESGAGKSTLANALLGIKLLAGITGGTVTGVASHITFDPGIDDESEEFAKVYYRTNEDFADLLARLGQRHNVAIPNTLEELRAAFDGGAPAPSPAAAQEPANSVAGSRRAAEHTPGAALRTSPGDFAAEPAQGCQGHCQNMGCPAP